MRPVDYKYATVRYAGGAGALLCSNCGVVLKAGFDHPDETHYCEMCADAHDDDDDDYFDESEDWDDDDLEEEDDCDT